MKSGENDVLLHNNAANEFNSDVLVVKDVNPEKVRILGSAPDKEGFAQFVGGRYKIQTPSTFRPGTLDVTTVPRPTKPITAAEKAGVPKDSPLRQNIDATISGTFNKPVQFSIEDVAYFKALKNKNYKEARKLVNKQFLKRAGKEPIVDINGNPQYNYHATKATNFTKFDLSKAGQGSGNTINTEGSIYFSPYKEASLDVFKPKSLDEKNNFRVIKAFINGDQQTVVPLSEFVKTYNDRAAYNNLIQNSGDIIIGKSPKSPQTIFNEKMAKYIEDINSGDPFRIKFALKPSSPRDFMEEQLVDNIAVRNPNNIKLANVITYDDAGNIIPLSKRFNFKNPDIRYSLIPIGSGVSVAAISSKKHGGKMKLKTYQQGGYIDGIKYSPSYNTEIEMPEIKGYQPQFSLDLPGGTSATEEQVSTDTQPAPTVVKSMDLSKPENQTSESTAEVDHTTVAVSSTTGDRSYHYKQGEKEKFKQDLYNAYTKVLKQRGMNPAFAKYLVAQDALESR